MANSLKVNVADLFRERGLAFNREDKRVLDILFALEPDLDQVHAEEAGADEALRLIVADPLYTGDLTLAELEGRAAAQGG